MGMPTAVLMDPVLRTPIREFERAIDWAGVKVGHARRFAANALNKHTDLISSVGILAISTCLFVSKIVESIPKLLPRISLVVFNFGGIIWVNVQARDLLKSCRDFAYTLGEQQWQQVVATAAKVFYKGVNLLLTCAIFGSSVAAACGFSNAVLATSLALRPLSLASLAVNICSDIHDYFVNEGILRHIAKIESDVVFSDKVGALMTRFLERVKRVDSVEDFAGYSMEKRLADRIICQLDTQTLETFREKLSSRGFDGDPHVEALKIFFALQDGMKMRQAGVRDNLSLSIMGYISMGLCKMFPDSLIEMGTRWSMSVLYTDDLVRLKINQMDLETLLES